MSGARECTLILPFIWNRPGGAWTPHIPLLNVSLPAVAAGCRHMQRVSPCAGAFAIASRASGAPEVSSGRRRGSRARLSPSWAPARNTSGSGTRARGPRSGFVRSVARPFTGPAATTRPSRYPLVHSPILLFPRPPFRCTKNACTDGSACPTTSSTYPDFRHCRTVHPRKCAAHRLVRAGWNP